MSEQVIVTVVAGLIALLLSMFRRTRQYAGPFVAGWFLLNSIYFYTFAHDADQGGTFAAITIGVLAGGYVRRRVKKEKRDREMLKENSRS